METPPPIDADDALLTRFLLGELPEDERDRLREAYFEDDALFARLLSAEDDLIDAFARGTLPASERRRFEERFGDAPGQQRRLEFARLLSRAAPPAGAKGRVASTRTSGLAAGRGARPFLAIAAVALLATVVGLTWWMSMSHRAPGPGQTSRRPATAASETASTTTRTPEGAVPAPTARPDTAAMPAAVASVVLKAGLVRGEGSVPQLVLSPETRWAELHLPLDADVPAASAARYEAVVETASGAAVTREPDLGRDADGSVTVRLPASLLVRRDYVVMLRETSAAGTAPSARGYSFQVTR